MSMKSCFEDLTGPARMQVSQALAVIRDTGFFDSLTEGLEIESLDAIRSFAHNTQSGAEEEIKQAAIRFTVLERFIGGLEELIDGPIHSARSAE